MDKKTREITITSNQENTMIYHQIRLDGRDQKGVLGLHIKMDAGSFPEIEILLLPGKTDLKAGETVVVLLDCQMRCRLNIG